MQQTAFGRKGTENNPTERVIPPASAEASSPEIPGNAGLFFSRGSGVWWFEKQMPGDKDDARHRERRHRESFGRGRCVRDAALFTQLETRAAAEFVLAAERRAELVVATGSRGRVEPQAALLWFLTANEAREVGVDFVDERLRQIDRPEWMTRPVVPPRRINRHG